MIKVEVSSSECAVKSGVAAKTGKAYTIREQDAWAYLSDRDGKALPHPQRIRLSLYDDQEAYAPGVYQLCPSSLYVGDYSQLQIRARLRPLASAAVSRAA